MSRLLILTQTVDPNDPQLGFFHAWIAALAARVERASVVCLKKGAFDLPANVAVYSLGKETAPPARLAARYGYVVRFYRYVWRLRGEYDAVFVHMNQEYVLLGAPLWRLLGKRVYLWRNHYAGNMLTALACALAHGVFYTSRYSYTARSKHARRMPVGVAPSLAGSQTPVRRERNSILFLARLDPSKRAEVFLDALGILAAEGRDFTATIAGGPSDPASAYPLRLREHAKMLGIADRITFAGAVPSTETANYYRTHEIFVNCAQSGMFDKTIFEAAAAGTLVLASSDDFREAAGEEFYFGDGDHRALARQIARLLDRRDEWERLRALLAQTVEANTLPALADRLAAAMELDKK